MWTYAEENRFIDSVMSLPVFGVGILIFQEPSGYLWVEDGQNRLMCLQKFLNDGFAWTSSDGVPRKWSDFTGDEKTHFLGVQFPLNQYDHATLTDRIEIFTRHQGGRALVPGEIYHAFMGTSPIVKLAVSWFFDHNHPLHDRFTNIWGDHSIDEHKRYKTLEVAVALAACVLKGDTSALSRKYKDIQPFLSMVWTPDEISKAEGRINRLVSIYETASLMEPIPAGADGFQLKKKQWDVGTFTGYILHGILGKGLVVPGFDTRMAEKLVEHRRRRNAFTRNKDKSVLSETFHHELSSARSWTPDRWEHGLRYVFAPNMERPALPEDSDDSDTAE